jgi:hypothetical protein
MYLLIVTSQRLRQNVTAANEYIRNKKGILGRVDFYAIRVVSKEAISSSQNSCFLLARIRSAIYNNVFKLHGNL